jgi:isocitrate lyase
MEGINASINGVNWSVDGRLMVLTFEELSKATKAQEKEVEKWWNEPRFKGTTRPYAAKAVVALRGTFMQNYPSDSQAKKLWRILSDKFRLKEASFTFGALDPIQVTQMAKYLDTVYVSGWQSSSTASSSNGKNL